jgi:hypothetical protein
MADPARYVERCKRERGKLEALAGVAVAQYRTETRQAVSGRSAWNKAEGVGFEPTSP